MRAEIVALEELDASRLGAWRELAAGAIEPNPFFEQEIVMPASRALAKPGEVALLIAADQNGQWAACAPVVQQRDWHRIPLRCLSTWRHPYSFLGTPLIAQGTHGVAGMSAMLALAYEQPRTGFFGMDLMGSDGSACLAIAEAADRVGSRQIVFAEATRGGLRRGNAAGLAAMSKKRRHDAQRTRRRLEERLGSTLETCDLAGSPEAVNEFLRLEKSGWKGAAGTAFASLPGHDEFLIAICANLAAQGRLQLLSLQADGKAVAMKCNLRAGGVLFTFKTAYDEAFADYSPGKHLDLENIRIFNEEEATLMDSCAEPDNEAINRMLPDRLGIRTAAYMRAGLRGLPSAGVVAAAAAGRNTRRGL